MVYLYPSISDLAGRESLLSVRADDGGDQRQSGKIAICAKLKDHFYGIPVTIFAEKGNLERFSFVASGMYKARP
jgi:hypothetical protein